MRTEEAPPFYQQLPLTKKNRKARRRQATQRRHGDRDDGDGGGPGYTNGPHTTTRVIGGLRLFPPQVAAEKLGKSKKTLIRWKLNGTGPPITRIGCSVYYEESDLENWVRSLTEAAA